MSSGPRTKFMNVAWTGRQALWESSIHTDSGVELALCPAQCFRILDVHSKTIKVCRAGLSMWRGLWPLH